MPTNAGGCPSDQRLLAFAEGLLDAGARARLEGHLAVCSSCTAILGATYDDAGDEPEFIGRYRVIAEVGRGGMGRVLEAHDPVLERRVAIKLLLPGSLSARAHSRFVREAEALGKLHHPNVIEVFDLGRAGETPYFVMEFVDGANLDVWCRGRGPSEIVRCLLGAGKGLSAAHRAGILHRDFKPSNVIVGADGRARVGDFGLAGVEVEPETSGPDVPPVDSLTQTGALMGTLPYMAPELLEGAKASRASDQYAFCAAAFEVLYGRRPFGGADARELSAAIRRGILPSPPAGSPVPRRVYDVLARGLSVAPGDRFTSMRGLLRALGRRRRGAAASGFVVLGTVGAGAAAVAWSSADAPQCSGILAELDAAYGASARARVRAAFDASGLEYARPTMDSTLASLDAYAQRWRAGVRGACASAERGELHGDAFDRRIRCYRHAVQGLAATVEVLQSAEGATLAESADVLVSLPDASLCADEDRLARLPVLPDDAAEAAELAALEPVLSRLEALGALEDHDAIRELLREHEAELDGASYPPVRVRVLLVRSRLALAGGEATRARGMLLEAHELAVEHGLDHAAARTAAHLGRVASSAGSEEKPERWFDMSLAIAEANGFTHLRANTLLKISKYRGTNDDLAGALEAAGQALALIEHDETFPRTTKAEILRAYSDWAFGHSGGDAGLEELERAQEILQELHGDTHAALGRVEHSLQIRASRRGAYEVALAHAKEALRIAEVVHGDESTIVAVGHLNLAVSLKNLGRFDAAVAELEGVERYLDERGHDWPEMRVALLINLANALLGAERNDEARSALIRARTLVESRIERMGERRVAVLGLLALVELRDGAIEQARRVATDALEASREVYGPEHPQTADVLARLGHVEIEAGHFARARSLLERSLAIEDRAPRERARSTFLLARATDEDPQRPPEAHARAVALAREARGVLLEPPVHGDLLTEVRAWLKRASTP